jgi:hypothetical protein
VTPDQISASAQLNHSISHDDTRIPSPSGIDLDSPLHANSPISASGKEVSTRLLGSPAGAANIRVRRSNPGKALLQSPARAGYTSRMRQIFEDASHGQSELQGNSAQLYPQLSNISRTAAPVVTERLGKGGLDPRNDTHRSHNYRPEPLCLSTALLSVVTPTNKTVTDCQRASQCSPGSWSDDSGYIITETRDHKRSPAVPLQQMVQEWLYSFPDQGCENFTSGGGKNAQQLSSIIVEQDYEAYDVFGGRCQMMYTETSSMLNARSHAKLSMAGPSSALDDPFAISANRGGGIISPCMVGRGHHGRMPKSIIATKAHQAYARSLEGITDRSGELNHDSEQKKSGAEADEAEDGDTQLSPLSPNVCIERGPSRYHSNRKFPNENSFTTPSREGPTAGLYSPQKENGIRVKKTRDIGSPQVPRSGRFGTRFRPQQ